MNIQPPHSRQTKTTQRWLSGCVLLLLASSAYGFGFDGHQIVGEIAFARLLPGPRAEVVRLLQDPRPHALARACNWPDQVKRLEGFEWSEPLHYVNIPRHESRFEASRDCPRGQCIVAAIGRFADELASPELPDDRRARALKFVCHLVGDLHQPLHTGYADDRGGNLFQLTLRGENTNLHSVWDHVLVAELGPWSAAARAVQKECEIKPQATWKPSLVLAWMDESRALVMADVYPKAHRLSEAYIHRNLPVIRRRLCLAGKRTGWLLNTLLAPPARD